VNSERRALATHLIDQLDGATSDELATYDWEPQEALNSGAVVVRRGTGR
jgi:hypothetical protein